MNRETQKVQVAKWHGIFRKQRRHHRFCYNARCDLGDLKIPERSQQIADRVYDDAFERGNADDKKAVKILGIQGMRSIVEVNRNGFRHRDTILVDLLDPEHRTRNLNDCIWNVLEATLLAKEVFGE